MARPSGARSTTDNEIVILLSKEVVSGARELSRLSDLFADERGPASRKAKRAMTRHTAVEFSHESLILSLRHFRASSGEAIAAKRDATDAVTPRRADGSIYKDPFADKHLSGEPWQQLAASFAQDLAAISSSHRV